jgi:hypothetical protein
MGYDKPMRCYKCKEDKDEEEFNWKNKSQGIRQGTCRECKKIDQKAYYEANKTEYARRSNEAKRVRVDANKLYARSVLKTGCVDCGFSDVRALEFDHISGDKVAGVMEMVWQGRSLESIKAEIAKCVVRCKNCHAIRTVNALNKEPYWLN